MMLSHIARLLSALALISGAFLHAQTRFSQEAVDRDLRHATVEWAALAPHLPNPTTGLPQDLQTAADVLRARRMPEDALDYYRYALTRGGDEVSLLKRIGITQLELRQPEKARVSFQRAATLKVKDGEAWNNLGAAEYVLGNFRAAIDDYKKAVKLSKKTAVYHSNLGTAYFDNKDYESARKEIETAVKLDPAVYKHAGSGGVEAHILSPQDRGKFCFELARVAARAHEDAMVMEWLAKATESGFDIRYEMDGDRTFADYWKDKRVALLVRNAKIMRDGQLASAIGVPALAPETGKN